MVKTWAPRGCTPIHRHRQKRDKISVISGISISPKRQRLSLYYHLYYDNIGQQEVCLFLRQLLRHLRGTVIALLDNSSTHGGEPLRKLLRQHSRLRIEHFPSYAPELNPDEGVWSLAKRELANGCPHDIEELMNDVIRSIHGIRRSPAKLRGCILQSDLPLFYAEHCIIYAQINNGHLIGILPHSNLHHVFECLSEALGSRSPTIILLDGMSRRSRSNSCPPYGPAN